MKTIIKCLLWAIALIVVALAMVYCFYLILLFWLFSYDLQLWLSVGALVVLFVAYWKIVGMAEC